MHCNIICGVNCQTWVLWLCCRRNKSTRSLNEWLFFFPQSFRGKSIYFAFNFKEHCHVIKNWIPFFPCYIWQVFKDIFVHSGLCNVIHKHNNIMVSRPEMQENTQCPFTYLFKRNWHIPSIPCCLPLSRDFTHSYSAVRWRDGTG